MKSRYHFGIILASAALFQTAAQAAVEEGTLDVTATVIAQCTVTTAPIAFGQISPLQAASATGSISISCDADNALDGVTLNGGSNEDTGARRMASVGNYIPYTISVNAAEVAVGGDIKDDFTLAGSGPYEDSVDVLGTIAVTGTPRALGEYSDTITVTLQYSAP